MPHQHEESQVGLNRSGTLDSGINRTSPLRNTWTAHRLTFRALKRIIIPLEWLAALVPDTGYWCGRPQPQFSVICYLGSHRFPLIFLPPSQSGSSVPSVVKNLCSLALSAV